MNTSLSQAQIKGFKTVLLKERKILRHTEVDGIRNEKTGADVKTELASNRDDSTSLVLLETDLTLEGHILDSVWQINQALERIQNGSYGICVDCEHPIPVARLEAFPAAARCLGCKSVFEANSRQYPA